MNYSAIIGLLGNRITYFGIMALGAAIGAVFLYLDNEDRAIRTTYKKTSCTIEHAEVTMDEHVSRGRYNSRRVTRTYYPEIVYVYQVNGEEIEGNTYRAFEQGMNESEAATVVGRYAPGGSSFCYVNPEDPEDAVLTLDSDPRLMYATATVGLLFLFAGMAGWILIDFILPKLESAGKAAKTPQPDYSIEIPEWSSQHRTS